MKVELLPNKQARQRQILREARRLPALRIADLARTLAVSGETVRRDLDDLSRAGLLRRIYGGATLPDHDKEDIPGAERLPPQSIHDRIAATAAERAKGNQTIILSGGAVARSIARHLAHRPADLTLITSDIGVATSAAGGFLEVLLCPGSYDPDRNCVTGSDTIEFLGRFNADLAVISGDGLSADGASDAWRGSANVKRAMLRAAASAILVVEPRHLGQTALQEICRLDALNEIVTGGRPPQPITEACRAAGVTLTLA